MYEKMKQTGRRLMCVASLVAVLLAFPSGGQAVRAAQGGTSLESLLVSNIVRLSAAHAGRWQGVTLRDGVQLKVERFSKCGCETAIFGLHRRYGSLVGTVYVDAASRMNGGRITISSAADFARPKTYQLLWQDARIERQRPASVNLRTGKAAYLVVRIAQPACCLTVDLVARVMR